MGQVLSSNSVYVHLDRPVYSPGDTVNGIVLLNCKESFHATALVLKVEGYERTRWEEQREDRDYDNDSQEWRTTTNTMPRSGRRDFFKIKMPLQSFQERVNPGQYQYPFTFNLPMGLPGSFEFSGNMLLNAGITFNYLKAKVCYKVKAECEVPGLLKPNLRFKAHLQVHQRMSKAPSEVVVQDTQTVKACCCVDKGRASITAQVEKDSYLPGETARVIVQIDNQSGVEFKAVEAQLLRSIALQTDGAGIYETRDRVASASGPGANAGVTQAGSGARHLSVQLPADLQPTSLGQLVKCDYTLEVRCKPAAFLSDLSVKLPVAIYQAAPASPVYTTPPPGWNPEVVAPPLVVQLPSAPPMPPATQQMHPPSSEYQPPQPTYASPAP